MSTAQVSGPDWLESRGPYAAPHCTVRGVARGSLFHPGGFSLWRVAGSLAEGTEIEWRSDHGDEAVFVLQGSLDLDGVPIDQGSALIIEAGAPAIMRCLVASEVVHFGPASVVSRVDGPCGPAAEDGRHAHVVTRELARTIRFEGGDGATSVYFGDGTCPTCRITVFAYDGSVFSGGYRGVSHLHSEDEIMHVLDGELEVGSLRVAAGESIAVPRQLRYSFRTPGPFNYLTYRADVSTAVVAPGSAPVVETVANLGTFSAGTPE